MLTQTSKSRKEPGFLIVAFSFLSISFSILGYFAFIKRIKLLYLLYTLALSFNLIFSITGSAGNILHFIYSIWI